MGCIIRRQRDWKGLATQADIPSFDVREDAEL
jgi:hypothetical protein